MASSTVGGAWLLPSCVIACGAALARHSTGREVLSVVQKGLPPSSLKSCIRRGAAYKHPQHTKCGLRPAGQWRQGPRTVNMSAQEVPQTVQNLVRAELSFKSGDYSVRVGSAHPDILCLEVERREDGSRWRGDFTARCMCLRQPLRKLRALDTRTKRDVCLYSM